MNADLVNIAPMHITSMAEDVPYPFWLLKGAHGHVIWANQEAEKWTGQSIRSQITKGVVELLSLPEEVSEAYRRCLETESAMPCHVFSIRR